MNYIPIGSTAIIFLFKETLVLNVTFLMGLFHLKFCRRFKMGPVRPCSDENQIIRQRPRRHNYSQYVTALVAVDFEVSPDLIVTD